MSDVRGKAHEHKKVGVIEKFLVNVVLYYLCASDVDRVPETQDLDFGRAMEKWV